jgi:kynurenine formamidase
VAGGQVIEEDQIERLLGDAERFGSGDALLIRTGWGSVQRARELKERFVLDSPRLSKEAARALARLLRERGSPFLAIDTPCLVDNAQAHAQREWLALPAWLRPPWPSDIARTYLRHYNPEKLAQDWGGDRILLQACPIVLALANAHAVTQPHVLLTALPFFVEDAPASPVTVVAKPVPVAAG